MKSVFTTSCTMTGSTVMESVITHCFARQAAPELNADDDDDDDPQCEQEEEALNNLAGDICKVVSEIHFKG